MFIVPVASFVALFAFWSPGPGEMLLLLVVALLLYGGNLPEVARSWGKSFAEFRRGLSGIQNDLNDAIYNDPPRLEYRNSDDDYTAPENYADDSYQPSDQDPKPEEADEKRSESTSFGGD